MLFKNVIQILFLDHISGNYLLKEEESKSEELNSLKYYEGYIFLLEVRSGKLNLHTFYLII